MSRKAKYSHSLPDEIFDDSSRLLKCQREMLKSMQLRGMSYRELGEYYGIGKSTAYYICNPGAAVRKTEKWLKTAKKYYKTEKAVMSATKSRKKAKELQEKFKLVF